MVPTNLHKYLIGVQGKNIQKIQQETNTKLELGKDGKIKILAMDDKKIHNATQSILKVLEQYVNDNKIYLFY